MPRPAAKAEATATAVKLRLVGTIGAMTDAMFDIREKKRVLTEQVDALDDQYKKIEEQLMAKLESEGTDKGSGKKATCSVTTSVVGQVDDWDAFNAYVKRTGYFHLYQRRLSDPAVRELFESKTKIPGVTPFHRKRLNLRAA